MIRLIRVSRDTKIHGRARTRAALPPALATARRDGLGAPNGDPDSERIGAEGGVGGLMGGLACTQASSSIGGIEKTLE